MKISEITSRNPRYDLPEQLGYSQQYDAKQTAHLVEVETDDGVTGWGDCFGPGSIAIANKGIVAPLVPGVLAFDGDGFLKTAETLHPPEPEHYVLAQSRPQIQHTLKE